METSQAHTEPTESLQREQERLMESAEEEQVSGLIRRVRRMAKFSQRQLAHELGVSPSAVVNMSKGHADMRPRISDFEVSPAKSSSSLRVGTDGLNAAIVG